MARRGMGGSAGAPQPAGGGVHTPVRAGRSGTGSTTGRTGTTGRGTTGTTGRGMAGRTGTGGRMDSTRRGGTPNSTRFYTEMTVAGLLSAFVGSLIFNGLIDRYYVTWPNLLIVTVGMAIMAFLIVLSCGMVESVRMAISDRQGGLSAGKALLCAVAAAIVVGAAAAGFEFIYELGYRYTGVCYDDYLFVIDDSGSMMSSDHKSKRYSALEMLLETMDDTNMAGLVRFSDKVDAEIAPALLDGTHRSAMNTELAKPMLGGGTDIQEALLYAADLLEAARRPDHSTVVVLLSDGGASVDLDRVLQRYNDMNVDICTVALGMGADRVLLQKLADGTGGLSLEVKNADMLRSTYLLLNGGTITRNLLLPRIGSDRGDILHAVMCVVFLAALGVLIGGALILMFNTSYMNTHPVVCTVASLGGALLLELGNDLGMNGFQRTVLLVLYGLILIQCGVRGVSGYTGTLVGNRKNTGTPGEQDVEKKVLEGKSSVESGRGRGRGRGRR